jgi:hypothetical protein
MVRQKIKLGFRITKVSFSVRDLLGCVAVLGLRALD